MERADGRADVRMCVSRRAGVCVCVCVCVHKVVCVYFVELIKLRPQFNWNNANEQVLKFPARP